MAYGVDKYPDPPERTFKGSPVGSERFSMCMGDPRYEKQCQNCKRLPREPEDEDTKDWIEPDFRKTCGKQMEVEE